MALVNAIKAITTFLGYVLKYGIFVYFAYFLVRALWSIVRLVRNRFDVKNTIFKPKLFEFMKWLAVDIRRILKYGRKFHEYGLTLYAGRQGSGKTLSLVEYLERMRKKYPLCKIYTNFAYAHRDGPLTGWHDLVTLQNGEDGVIFGIDELQNEWDSNDYRNVPAWILAEVTQQRKQRVKIVSTSQVFTRVAKQFREQCFDVVECAILGQRWIFQKAYDAYEYEAVLSNPEKKHKLHRKYRRSFVASDELRGLYDTYQKITRIERGEYKPAERVQVD